jgi:hypothetical protein
MPYIGFSFIVFTLSTAIFLSGCLPASGTLKRGLEKENYEQLPTILDRFVTNSTTLEEALEAFGKPCQGTDSTMSYVVFGERTAFIAFIPAGDLLVPEGPYTVSMKLVELQLDFSDKGIFQRYEFIEKTSEDDCVCPIEKAGISWPITVEGPPRVEKTIPILMREAESGVAESQFQLYLSKKSNSLKWLCSAADQGYAPARYELGTLFWKGSGGVPQDLTRAYMWYTHVATATQNWASLPADSVAAMKTSSRRSARASNLLHDILVRRSELADAEELLGAWEAGQCESELARN